MFANLTDVTLDPCGFYNQKWGCRGARCLCRLHYVCGTVRAIDP